MTRGLAPARASDRARAVRRAGSAERLSTRPLPPGPRLPALLQTALLWARPFPYLRALAKRHDGSFTLRVPGHPALVFESDPEVFAAIHTAPEDDLRPGEGAAAVRPIVGEHSFMLAEGSRHAITRDALLSELSASEVRRHETMTAGVARRAVASWPTEHPIALHRPLRELTLEVTLRLLLGYDDRSLPNETIALREAILAMLEVTSMPLLTERYLRLLGPGRRAWRRFLVDRERVDRMLLRLIEARGGESCSSDGERGSGLLDVICSLHDTDGSAAAHVRDDVMSLILAGHETTAAQLAWALQLLAHHPEIQSRLSAEIDGGAEPRYMRATVLETLRHRCVFVFGIPRQLTRSRGTELAGGSGERPVQLLPCTYLLHHDPERFPDPQRFAPERFLDASPDPRAFLPWGGGRRRCPGAHLATLELETVLHAVLSAYAVEPASRRIERPRWRSVIVAPHRGGRVVLRERASEA